ncbi:MAG: acetyl-CoA synthetase [Candidatus Omnitrophota bacterium]|jgi:acetyl-CoA synthetase
MTEPAKNQIEALLEESREFEPSEAFVSQANIKDNAIYKEASANPLKYWEDWAKQLEWSKPWSKTLEWNPPHAKWFVDGKINACVNCVDRHAIKDGGAGPLANKTAILWEGEPGDKVQWTYAELYKQVNLFANVLKGLGVQKGDRIAIYMPMVPEIVVACLAAARIGAIHSVVFGGFSAEALRDRIQDQEAVILITADYGYRRGKHIPLKEAADEAASQCDSIQNVIVVQRDLNNDLEANCHMQAGRDLWWHECMAKADPICEPEVCDAEDILFILYTSGTTGKPKGIVHTTGGYMTGVHATTQWVFDLKPDDIYWCTADVGWITGHSYLIYGPLSNGATVMMYEGSPDYPDKGRLWQLVEDYKPTIFYTAPTAIRAFMKWGLKWIKGKDLSSLRLLGSVGEPINPEAWIWYQEQIGHKLCPVVDTWWQTETGAIMVTTLPGVSKTKPGSAGMAFPGIEVKALNEAGAVVEKGGGFAAITQPWPSMLRTIYRDDERYKETYWSKWSKDIYFPGDGIKLDDEGYFWFLGRVDDVMNISGHRIGTMEVESALVDYLSVAEAAVVSRPHEIKGESIVAFVTLKEGIENTPDLMDVIKAHVVKKIGAIARPEEIIFSADLPKTRSGKIMRRLLRDIALGKALGDTTTLADPTIVEGLRQKYESIES